MDEDIGGFYLPILCVELFIKHDSFVKKSSVTPDWTQENFVIQDVVDLAYMWYGESTIKNDKTADWSFYESILFFFRSNTGRPSNTSLLPSESSVQ